MTGRDNIFLPERPDVGVWHPAWGLTIDPSLKEVVMNSNPRCEACGMPMNNTPRHSKQNLIGRYCLYCTTPAGELKSRDEIREGMIQYKMNLENWARSQAEAAVDQQMAQLPAWQGAA